MYSAWLAMRKCTAPSNGILFRPTVRTRVAAAVLRIAGTVCGVYGSRMGAHPMWGGGASAMSEGGYDAEVIRRRGSWIPNTAHQCLRGDQYTMPSVGKGAIAQNSTSAISNEGRALGRSRYRGKGGAPGRLRCISRPRVVITRHMRIAEEKPTRFGPLRVVCGGGRDLTFLVTTS